MFERFTDRSRRVVVLSQEEARLMKHKSIGTDSMLAGLVHEGEGVAAQVLTDLGVTLESVRVHTENKSGKETPPGHIPFTPACKKALEYALREALQMGHNYIGTEHLLLALVRQDGVEPSLTSAIEVLQEHAITPADVREAVIAKLQGYAKNDAERITLQTEMARVRREAEDAKVRTEMMGGIRDLTMDTIEAIIESLEKYVEINGTDDIEAMVAKVRADLAARQDSIVERLASPMILARLGVNPEMASFKGTISALDIQQGTITAMGTQRLANTASAEDVESTTRASVVRALTGARDSYLDDLRRVAPDGLQGLQGHLAGLEEAIRIAKGQE